MDVPPLLPGPPPPAESRDSGIPGFVPPPLLAVLISDAGTHEAASFYPRLRRWLKSALRGYGLRCQGVRREPPVDAAPPAGYTGGRGP